MFKNIFLYLSGKRKNLFKVGDFYLAFGVVAFFAVLYSFMSVRRHLLFETMGWDLSIFDQGIWYWSKFKIPYSSFHDLPWLADHFHLALSLLAPFYWIYSSAMTLVVLQAVLVCLGAIPLYLLAIKITNHKPFALWIVFSYLLFFSLQWFIFSGFHELALLPVTLGFVFYFWETRQSKLYWFSLILCLLVKEEIGLLIFAFGVYGFLSDRKRKLQSILTMFFGLVTTVFLVEYLMPQLASGAYRHSGYGLYGDSFSKVIINILKNPLLLFNVFTDSPVKLNTIFVTAWPWGFLPLFSPLNLILVVEQFLTRFIDYEKTIRWTPFYAYSLPMATLMAWSSIYAFKNITSWFKKSYLVGSIIVVFLFVVTFFEQYLLKAPIASIIKKEFYRTESWMVDNKNAIKCVPNNASLSAQNNIAPWVSQREKIKVFPEGLKEGYDYIIVNLYDGQNQNGFFFFGREKTVFVVNDLINRNLYEVTCKFGDAMVLKRMRNTKGELNYPFELEIYER